MKVAIVTSANLGAKQNLKTPDIEPVIRIFSESGDLVQIICQLKSRFYFPATFPAVPAIVRYPLHALDRYFGLSRRIVEAVFDYFAARRLAPADIVILHGGYFMSRTAAQARERGSIIIELAVIAPLSVNAALEEEEASALGLGDVERTYAHMRDIESTVSPDYVIALSEFVAQGYRALGFPPDRIWVAAPDIDLARFVPVLRPDTKFRALYMAHTNVIKGLHYLLDAWEALALKDAELVLAGGWDVSPALKRLYDTRIWSMRTIRVIGLTQHPEEVYPSADVLVFPSLTEGFGRVTIEAMASGIPVITTENAQGIVENGVTGYVVPIRDSAALADRIKYMYEHREEARGMGRTARAAAARKQPFGDAVYSVYKNILRREGKGDTLDV